MRIFITIYFFAVFVISFGSTLLEIYPGLFLINLFAPDPGDRYSVNLVWILTCLVLASPAIFLLYIQKVKRKSKISVIPIEQSRTGIFILRQNQLQNALWPATIFINDNEVGLIDTGIKLFFEVSPGKHKVRVGKGWGASDILELEIKENEQLNLHIEVIQKGLKNVFQLRKLRAF